VTTEGVTATGTGPVLAHAVAQPLENETTINLTGLTGMVIEPTAIEDVAPV
jgi:hypothetical protein